MRIAITILALLAVAPALVQGVMAQGVMVQGFPGGIPGLSNIPGLGQAQETPEQKRAFCQRVASAATRCGLTLDMMALASCLVRTLPVQDSLRVAQTAERARGNPSALLGDCGISLGR